MRRPITSLAIAVALIPAGCGGGEATPPTTSTAPVATGATGAGAAADLTPSDQRPGEPEPGLPVYTALGSWWKGLPERKRVESAAKFIADDPEDCINVDPEDLERQTYVAFAYNYPEAARVSDVMRDTCELLLH